MATSQEHLSRLSYSVKDELTEKKLGIHGSQALQILDYTYLENGFLSGINADLHQKSVMGTTYQSGSAFHSNYSYNERGNFIEVNRTGNQGQQIDSLVYSYKSRTIKLLSVLDRGNEEGFDERSKTASTSELRGISK